MKIGVLVLFLVTTLLLPAAHAEKVFNEQPPFHPPLTAPEKALDLALKSRDGGRSSMTPGLLNSIERTAEKQRNGRCANSGNRIDTMRCEGLEIDSAITCREISHSIFIYRTISANDREATVDVRWPQYAKAGVPDWDIGSPIGNTYRLVRGKTSWMIDGIDCGGLYKYNISVKSLQVFHLVASDPERALDQIYRLNEDETIDLYGFIFNYPTHSHAKDKELSQLFSQEFLNRSEKEERSLIKESCGGRYPADGQPCDMIRDVNPIFCAQDHPELFLYRTIDLGEKEAIVISTWPKYMPDGPAYRLVQKKGHWMLDAIYCDGHVKNKER